jgi:CelD/BcsL family acetyltransferase involved in cellulose biosynthesis
MTRKRLGLPPQPYVFFESLWTTFFESGRLSLLLAKKNGEATAALILFKFKDRVSAEIAASDERYRDISPNHYLFWEAIKLACEQGYRIFDFGRTSPNNHSLMDFKERWGTKVIDLHEYYYPRQLSEKFAEPEGSIRYKLIKNICRNVPTFASQCIGHFCYRHLG